MFQLLNAALLSVVAGITLGFSTWCSYGGNSTPVRANRQGFVSTDDSTTLTRGIFHKAAVDCGPRSASVVHGIYRWAKAQFTHGKPWHATAIRADSGCASKRLSIVSARAVLQGRQVLEIFGMPQLSHVEGCKQVPGPRQNFRVPLPASTKKAWRKCSTGGSCRLS